MTTPHDASDDPTLLHHRRLWAQRPLLREVYYDLYRRVVGWLAPDRGPIVELGAGGGNFKEYCPDAIATDLTWCSWLDVVADGTRLPFRDAGVGNLVLFDVFHHLPFPARMLAEAQRVLASGGRLILCEPYVSWVSGPIYRLLHPEPTDTRVRPLAFDPDTPVFDVQGPWSSNQAVPTALFWRDRREFAARFPGLTVLCRQALSTFVYPLSGGFEKRCWLPRALWSLGWAIERVTAPLARWTGFRCLIVIESRRDDASVE